MKTIVFKRKVDYESEKIGLVTGLDFRKGLLNFFSF